MSKETKEENVTKVDLSAKAADPVEDNVTKLDLSEQPKEDTDAAVDTAGVDGSDETTDTAPKQEEVQAEEETQVESVVEEVVVEEVTKEEVEQAAEEIEAAVVEAKATGNPLPESVQKLVDFMQETGGGLEDYMKLNRNVEELDNMTALKQYYENTKPHLSSEELDFLLEDKFSYDEEYDDNKDIMRKKLALKEEVASAKKHLENQKSKYYEEIKNGSALTPESNKALEFFNRYNKEQEATKVTVEKQRNAFDQKTNNLFNEEFKGFEYKIGDKTFRYNVKNAQEIKNTQSDINNFVKRFLAEDNTMSDAKGYHKSLYTAMNADSIAQHFYEQGKADALKDSIAKSKNVSMQPRQGLGEVKAGGTTFKILGGETSADFKVKLKKSN